MGATPSKEQLLYQEVQNGNHDTVKSLRREGTSLEWVDKEGRTPLIMACLRGELLDMVITLLNLGANMNAYRSGAHGGFPLHHAAKRGLEKTVTLLLSRGANPLAINDDDHTPLDVARSRGHVAVVRLLEERLCLFSGTVREISGFGVFESFAPKLVTKKIWAVVLPSKSKSGTAALYELAIYESPKVSLWNGVHLPAAHPAGFCNVAQPRTVVALANAEIEEPNFNLADPVLYVTDKAHKTKYKLYSGSKGDKAQLERLYKACKGNPMVQSGAGPVDDYSPPTAIHQTIANQQGNLSQIHPLNLHTSPGRQPILQSISAPSPCVTNSAKLDTSIAESMPEELALSLALDESIRTAIEEGIPVSPNASSACSVNCYQGWDVPELSSGGWGPPDPSKHQNQGWDVPELSSGGWGPPDPNKHQNRSRKRVYGGLRVEERASHNWEVAESGMGSFQSGSGNEQPIASIPSAPPLPGASVEADGLCVVCWDSRAEGACIPCGHLAGCMKCLMEVKAKSWSCPVCRGPIEQVIKVYAV